MSYLLNRKSFTLFGVVLLSAGLLQFAFGQPPGGGPNAPDRMLLEQYDGDGDGVLNTAERKLARADLEKAGTNQRRRGPRGRSVAPGKPGPKVSPADVANFPDASLFDTKALRTVFLEFESEDWEKELAVFKPTDIEVPAKLTVDGKVYPNVGVSFRGASSFFMIPEGLKRSLNLSIDFMDKEQRLYGYKSLNLLNCNGDASMMSSALYSYLAGQKIPTPKVNHVKVVINGEYWGVYVSSQQFNKTFVKEHFAAGKGARWKVNGSPRGDGGLRYLGEDIDPYRERFDIKSKDKDESWQALINLCKVLNTTPVDDLEKALSPILDLDGLMWFLAVDVAAANSDGYWTRASDYSIFLDEAGKFHILPHDMNEAFQVAGHGGPPGGGGPRGFGGPPGGGRGAGGGPGGFRGPPPGGGPEGRGGGGGGARGGGRGGPGGGRGGGGARGGGGGGRGGGGVLLDPLVGLDNEAEIERKPLRGRLLQNPELKQRYLKQVKAVAELLRWENLSPRVKEMRQLIKEDVATDTRKLSTTEEFLSATSEGIQEFAEKRSAFLLEHEAIKKLSN